MGRYVTMRLLQAIPVLLLTSAGVWLLVYLLPGDPAHALLGPDASAQQLESARRRMGLDQPLVVQYLLWLGHVLQGDLGVSYLTDVPVRDLLGQRILVTLHLAAATILVAPAIAIPLG